MTLEQFVNKVRNAACAYFGDGLTITAQKIMKNNGVERRVIFIRNIPWKIPPFKIL